MEIQKNSKIWSIEPRFVMRRHFYAFFIKSRLNLHWIFRSKSKMSLWLKIQVNSRENIFSFYEMTTYAVYLLEAHLIIQLRLGLPFNICRQKKEIFNSPFLLPWPQKRWNICKLEDQETEKFYNMAEQKEGNGRVRIWVRNLSDRHNGGERGWDMMEGSGKRET